MGQSTYRISMDKRWDLEDLYLLPHAREGNWGNCREIGVGLDLYIGWRKEGDGPIVRLL